MSKVSNVLTMLEYLSTGRKYSIKQLSSLLEVSPRMIRVYKDELEKAGIYIDTIKGPYGGYVLNKTINVPKRFITPKSIDGKYKDFFNQLSKAIKDKRKCFIKYYSKDKKEISERVIHPYDLILLYNKWGVAAYCELKNEIRHFYLDRIKEINILENIYN